MNKKGYWQQYQIYDADLSCWVPRLRDVLNGERFNEIQGERSASVWRLARSTFRFIVWRLHPSQRSTPSSPLTWMDAVEMHQATAQLRRELPNNAAVERWMPFRADVVAQLAAWGGTGHPSVSWLWINERDRHQSSASRAVVTKRAAQGSTRPCAQSKAAVWNRNASTLNQVSSTCLDGRVKKPHRRTATAQVE